MSSKGETRRSHLPRHLRTFRKDEECSKQISQLPSKRQREERENQIILVNQTSIATLVEETINEDDNFFSLPMSGERRKEQVALTLNCLKDKNAYVQITQRFFVAMYSSRINP